MWDTWDTLIVMLENLEIKSELVKTHRARLISIKNDEEASQFLIELDSESHFENCTACDGRHFCSLFLACLYYKHRKFLQAEHYTKDAIQAFKRMGSKWNEMLAHWTYGELLILLGRQTPARQELQTALDILKNYSKNYLRQNAYEKYDNCNFLINTIDQHFKDMPHFIGSSNEIEEKQPESHFIDISNSDLIVPAQDFFRAKSDDTFIYNSTYLNKITISTLDFDGIPHQVFNILEPGEPIILFPSTYRWLCVYGTEMENATPIPLRHRDFVLVIDSTAYNFSAEHGDIIVGSMLEKKPTPKTGVIRYFLREGLVSAGKQDVPTIPLTDVTIRGKVIAVAKPALQVRHEPTYKQEPGSPSLEKGDNTGYGIPTRHVRSHYEETLRDALLHLLHNNEIEMDRLIEMERGKKPNTSYAGILLKIINDLQGTQ